MTTADWIQVSHKNCGNNFLWGVQILPGMRLKDLPLDLRMVTEKHEGALEPLRFHSGKFYHVDWRWPLSVPGEKPNPLVWPEPVETEVLSGGYLIETTDGGISYIPPETEGVYEMTTRKHYLNERPEQTYNFCLELRTQLEPDVLHEFYLYGMRDETHAAEVFAELPEVPRQNLCSEYTILNVF